jgi:hypothetical protein
MKHIEQPPIRLVEVLSEAVNGDDDPVSVATVTLLNRRYRLTSESLLDKSTQRLVKRAS